MVLAAGTREVATWPRYRDGRADLSVIDGLARAQVSAKRFGWTVTVRDATQCLVELIDFAGLDVSVEVRG